MAQPRLRFLRRQEKDGSPYMFVDRDLVHMGAMPELTHFDESGGSRMVDVSAKPATLRVARASAQIAMQPATQQRIRQGEMKKGNVLEVARLAGIMAAKRTDELIPLCHSLPLHGVDLDFSYPDDHTVRLEATVRTIAPTGVEMEALTAVAVAALTIYDMCKAIDRGMVVGPMQLEEKQGGASGHFQRNVNVP